ncbi:GNAT family N-acetyltransferase [Phytomonospora endophytica]|uniref:GNAT superfamily N-acetyltransferase n=1 Tax=Phytomonospora endophytica TaxID=714109 RepID=A0A841FAB8_9ACTN|nr:GNAT family N-acetyltransferase [Phytomonospora endophytica]MBB6034201.1 GNAT superfamily N-acetyltransferase [Phytomonospora endophytica]GIG66593.1 N-acetyltransferase [Phytomonospora endophytica]
MAFTLRPAEPGDSAFITDMLVEAGDWGHTGATSPERVARILADVKAARYVTGWQRPGDIGVVAADEDGAPIGACWSRLFTPEEPAYGFVAADVPELAIGVVRPWRGKGIGRTLLRELLDRAHAAGHARISLGVDLDNPARRLYEAEGFITVDTRPTAVTMVRSL